MTVNARNVVAAAIISMFLGRGAGGQEIAPRFEPIHRVAHEQQGGPRPQQNQVATRIVPAEAPANQPPFDLTQRPGEHPLMPALRVAQAGLVHMDQNIKDYQAILYKRERINGELQPQEVAFIKLRHEPFSVYLYFLAPNKGRECLYNAGPNGTKGVLSARDCGFRRKLGVFDLDPDGRLAMKGQKYPIYKIGIRSLITELIEVVSNDVNFGECEVRTGQTEIGPKNGVKRPCTFIQAVHPVPRDNFRFHKAEVFIDNELRVPIRYAAYLWPERPGEPAPLEEEYTYMDLKINNSFTEFDFDKENPNLFKD